MALICGPEPFEEDVRCALVDCGYEKDEMLFF
jgi:ferredoxin-NADP reductase